MIGIRSFSFSSSSFSSKSNSSMLVRLLLLAWFYQFLIGSAEAGVRSDMTHYKGNPSTITGNILEGKDSKISNTSGKTKNAEVMMPWFEEKSMMDKEKTSDKTRKQAVKNRKILRDKQMMNNMRKATFRNKIVRDMRVVKNIKKTALRNKILRKARIIFYLRLNKRDTTKEKEGGDKRLSRKNSYFSK